MNLSENLLFEEDLELLEPGDFIAISVSPIFGRRPLVYAICTGPKHLKQISQMRYLSFSTSMNKSCVFWYFLSIEQEQPKTSNGIAYQADVWLKFWSSEEQRIISVHIKEFDQREVRKVIQ